MIRIPNVNILKNIRCLTFDICSTISLSVSEYPYPKIKASYSVENLSFFLYCPMSPMAQNIKQKMVIAISQMSFLVKIHFMYNPIVQIEAILNKTKMNLELKRLAKASNATIAIKPISTYYKFFSSSIMLFSTLVNARQRFMFILRYFFSRSQQSEVVEEFSVLVSCSI